MAFISDEMTDMVKKFDLEESDECIGCETGVDYVGSHLNECGRYNKFCCTREAEKEREMLDVNIVI